MGAFQTGYINVQPLLYCPYKMTPSIIIVVSCTLWHKGNIPKNSTLLNALKSTKWTWTESKEIPKESLYIQLCSTLCKIFAFQWNNVICWSREEHKFTPCITDNKLMSSVHTAYLYYTWPISDIIRAPIVQLVVY